MSLENNITEICEFVKELENVTECETEFEGRVYSDGELVNKVGFYLDFDLPEEECIKELKKVCKRIMMMFGCYLDKIEIDEEFCELKLFVYDIE